MATIESMMKKFKNDIDDEGELNQYFSEYQIVTFLTRAIQKLNVLSPFIQSDWYLAFTPMKDCYDVPDDFVAPVNVADIKTKSSMRSQNLSEFYTKTQGAPAVYYWDERFRKFYFDSLPEQGQYGIEYPFISINGTDWFIMTDENNSIWDGNFFKAIVGSDEEVIRVGEIDSFCTPYTGTFDSASDTITLSETLGFIDDALIGIKLTIDGQELTITDYDEDNGSGKSVITVTAPSTAIADGNYSFEFEVFHKVYISERDVLGTGQLTLAISTTVIKQVDIKTRYYAFPPEYTHESVRTITGTTASTTYTLSANDSLLRVGCYIQVPRTNAGLVADGYARKVVSIDTNNHTVTVKSVFPVALTTSEYIVIDCDLSPNAPIEFDDIIIEYAKYYAYMRQRKLDVAMRVEAKALDMFGNYQLSEMRKVTQKKNEQRNPNLYGLELGEGYDL